MEKKIVHTRNAPEAIGPYSQAVIWNGLVFCSGQIGLSPESMKVEEEEIDGQTRQVMQNLGAVLKEAGSSFSQVLTCSIFLAHMEDFAAVNRIYGSFFTENPPARETVAVKELPKGVLIEISCTAWKKEG